jgi:antitoxin (DNA-binding transcriptional repressor) of toxin-antitoxin stability system
MTGSDGTVVQKGQPIFKITPDEKFEPIDPKKIEKERRARTSELLKAVVMSPTQKLYEQVELKADEQDERSMFIAAV